MWGDDVNLLPKRKRFAEEYIIDLNSTQAAIRAGYSPKTANEQGARLLADVSVKAAIEDALAERSKRTEITADRVLKELWSIATDDIRNYLAFRTEKTVVGYDAITLQPIAEYKTVVDVKNSRDIDTRNISEISVGKDGQFKFKLYCRDNALNLVGKHLGMFVDRSEISGPGGGPIRTSAVDLSKLTAEELAALEKVLCR